MSSNHTLTTGSLAHRVCLYFGKHRGEVLNDADIALKFDAERKTIPTLLHSAALAQYLAKRPGAPGTGAIYSAGKKLDEALNTEPFDLAAVLQPQDPPPAKATAKHEGPPIPRGVISPGKVPPAAKAVARPQMDISAIEIVVRTDVPLPTNEGPAKRVSQWLPILDKLTAAGMSIELPHEAMSAVQKALINYRKVTRRNIVTRRTGPKTFGVWRLADLPAQEQ
ncbi:MAG: hypothetical protein RJA98_3824 [Pseudomonadota bacterium]|jgi:hypothetical protein